MITSCNLQNLQLSIIKKQSKIVDSLQIIGYNVGLNLMTCLIKQKQKI